MKLKGRNRKVVDWVLRFGIILGVVVGVSFLASAQEKPGGKKTSKAKMVAERDEGEEEDSGVIEIEVRIPKPEALIFSNRMKTKYDSIGYEKGFSERIIDSAKHSPF